MKVNIEEYQYDFYKVIKDVGCRNCFLQYLRKDRSAENLQFIIECEKIYDCKTRTQLESHVTNIFNTFVKHGSPSEINLSGPLVKKIDKQWRAMVLVLDSTVTDAYRIFQPAIVSVMTTLEKDCFARFIRDPEWIHFVNEHFAKSVQDMEKIAVHQSQLEQMQIGLGDLERGYMTWWDIVFAQHMFRDGLRWKLKYSQQSVDKLRFVRSIDAYHCKVKFFDDLALQKYGQLVVYKHVINLDCSVHDLYTTCLSDKYPDVFDLHSFEENYQIIQAENSTDAIFDDSLHLHSAVFGQNVDLKIPFGLVREGFYCSTNVFVPELKTYYRITKPVPREFVLGKGLRAMVPDKSKQQMIGFNWMAFEQVATDKCRFIHVFANNLGGYLGSTGNWLSKTMGTTINKRQAKTFAKRVDSALGWYIDSGRPEVQDIGLNFEITKRNTELLEQYFQKMDETPTPDSTDSNGSPVSGLKKYPSASIFSASSKLN